MKFCLRRVTIRQANAFVAAHHRHSKPVRGAIFAIACAIDHGDNGSMTLAGVALVGRPVSRELQAGGETVEILRCCTDGTPNACSFLYGRSSRAALALGFRRVVTYTLQRESGASLRAANFKVVAEVRDREWGCQSRPRALRGRTDDRYRWELAL